MQSKKPSPSKVTEERIAKDKARADLLSKQLNKLLSPKSPQWRNWLSSTATNIANKVSSAFSTATNYVKSVATNVYNTVSSAATNVRDYASNLASSAYNAVSNAAGNVVGFVAEKAANVVNAVVDTGKRIVDSARNFFDSAKAAADDAVDNITDFASDAGGNVKEFVEDAGAAMGMGLEWLLEAMLAIPAAITELANHVKSLVSIDEEALVKGVIDTIKLQKRLREEMAKLEL